MRITIEIGDESYKRLRALARLNETHDSVEVIKRALATYDLLLTTEADKDAKTILEYPDGSQALVKLP